MARFGPQVAPYGQIVVYYGTWAQYLLPQQVPAQMEPRRPKNHPIPCFPDQILNKFGAISGPCREFSKMGPKIGPRPFPEQFRAAKIAGVKKTNGATADLFWLSNFWAILAVPRVVPLGNSGTVPGQILLGLQSRNTTKGSSEIIIGHQ